MPFERASYVKYAWKSWSLYLSQLKHYGKGEKLVQTKKQSQNKDKKQRQRLALVNVNDIDIRVPYSLEFHN